ncbi:MAG: hypothetical protein A2173_06770 [Planctomycetes bacterium RBG_13_44_8b]|nr:MAG: hypothetical protein A2173_06770 [Planctomycetes bacterium RBG_13_44_8b]
MTNFLFTFLRLSILVLLIECKSFAGQIIYVDDDSKGANDGLSWADAFNYLQDALASATYGDSIHVAQGIYTPDRGIGFTAGDRQANFSLKNGVAIHGGFAGFGEPDPNERDIEKYKTILSGDLTGNDIEVKDPCDLQWFQPTRAENSGNVIIGINADETAVLDGFTITAGYNSMVARNGNGPIGGAGMLNRSSSPTIINCTFAGNAAIIYNVGAGLFNSQGSKPILVNCRFTGNCASINGAAIYNIESAPKLINCVFYCNYAKSGSGIYNRNSNPVISGCTFINNSNSAIYNYSNSNPILNNCTFVKNTSRFGAGMYNENSSPKLTGCAFIGNIATLYGGGMFNGEGSYPSLFNCIFSGNSAEQGGGIFNLRRNSSLSLNNCTFSSNSVRLDGSGVYSYGEMTVTNCIFWGNVDPAIIGEAAVTVTYSDIQGGWSGEGNINIDPLFSDPGYWDPNGTPDDPNDDLWIDGDYHLKSQAGRWDPVSQSWIQDDITSPCIDAGDPNTPVGDEPFPNGGIINMGSYGGTAEASKSPTN